MNWEELLQALLKLTPQQREEKVTLFDYAAGKFVDLKDMAVCVDGEPAFHLTIN